MPGGPSSARRHQLRGRQRLHDADTCTGGVCQGDANADGCADDFLCYKSAGATFVAIPSVGVDDTFETTTVEVKKPKHVCVPTDKDGDGTLDTATHLTSYSVKQAVHVKQTGIVIQNQLGELSLDTIKPDLLFVPAHVDPMMPPSPPNAATHDVNHYKCYKARVTRGTPKLPVGIQVTVANAFDALRTFDVKKPKHLCTPVDKNGEGIEVPDAYLVCYKAKAASGQPKHTRLEGLQVADQFGGLVVKTIKEAELCIPSVRP